MSNIIHTRTANYIPTVDTEKVIVKRQLISNLIQNLSEEELDRCFNIKSDSTRPGELNGDINVEITASLKVPLCP